MSQSGLQGCQILYVVNHIDAIANGISLSKASDVRVTVTGTIVIEPNIAVILLAGELACVVACTRLVAYCAKNFIFIADEDILVIIG